MKTETMPSGRLTVDTEIAVFEHKFRAMGTEVHLVVVGGDPGLATLGEAQIKTLEARWSRFVDSSEISILNSRAGWPILVSDETFLLLTRSLEAWQLTDGCFNPCVGNAMRANGYDRDFSELKSVLRNPGTSVDSARSASVTPSSNVTSGHVGVPSPWGIELIPEINGVVLPAGMSIDAGGIGKGLAADMVVSLLTRNGALGVMANLGGDVRVMGTPPSDEGWVISVPDPAKEDLEMARFSLVEGAVATSSKLKRRWSTEHGEAHHLVDPRSGHPINSDVIAVSVVAKNGWMAEAYTKFLFVRGSDGLGDLVDAYGIVIFANGDRMASPEVLEILK